MIKGGVPVQPFEHDLKKLVSSWETGWREQHE